MHTIYFLLPRVLGAAYEKAIKINRKRNEYKKWWLVLTLNDGDGVDISLNYEPFKDLWYWVLWHAVCVHHEDMRKLRYEKVFLLDVNNGGYMEWDYSMARTPRLTINFGIAGWKPQGRRLLQAPVPQKAGWQIPAPTRGAVPKVRDIIEENAYLVNSIHRPDGTVVSSRIRGELFHELEGIRSQGDLPTIRNSLRMRLPIISPPLGPEPARIREFVNSQMRQPVSADDPVESIGLVISLP